MDPEELAKRLAATGLADAKVKEIAKNPQVAQALVDIHAEAGASPKEAPTLYHHLALASRNASAADGSLAKRKLVSSAIGDGRLQSTQQIDAAWKYVTSTETPTNEQLDKESGVGIVVTADDVQKIVNEYVNKNKAGIEVQRYKSLGPVMMEVKKLEGLRWANPALIKPAIDKEFLAVLGPKDERDNPKLQAKAQAKAKKESKNQGKAGATAGGAAAAAAGDERHHNMFEEGFLASLHKPGENPQKYPEFMKEHLTATHGKVFTRFPPEPNGFLHIGHAKAIAVDFGYAAFHKGECYLRFDDTNPEAEDPVYSESIRSIVSWLGFKPYKETWSSDYFDQLYALAEKLIENNGAYVCFCTAEQVKAHRGIKEDGTPGGARSACAERSQTPQETLKLFREMRDGKYSKGTATLRMRQDLENPNPQMWDLVAYRVLNAAHHRTGDKWKIYPTYDFTHCLVDSMENISHSLCTLEFRQSRESYEWLCDEVQVYRPQQREFGRFNMAGSIMSKRKLLQLVEGGYVRGWADPRLYTLVALRRRGVPPGAILSFISELGVTTSTTHIESNRFDNSIRKYLENNEPRLMMILDPVPVILDNLPEDYHEVIEGVPFKPGNPAMGEHSLPFTRKVYIDRSDFREEASANYYRLAPGQSVGLLKVPYTIRVTSFKKDETGKVTEIHAHYENDSTQKPKTFIQWVADSPRDKSPVKLAEVREFERLFKSDNPVAHPDGFLADINPESERKYTNAIIETGFHEVRENSPWRPTAKTEAEEILEGNDVKGAPESVRFQALRVGYYCMDTDSKGDSIVLNRIVTLKEDKSKSKN